MCGILIRKPLPTASMLEQFVFPVDSITKRTCGPRTPLPTIEERLRSLDQKINAAKTAERKMHHESTKKRLLARAQKVKALLTEEQKNKPTLSKPQPVIASFVFYSMLIVALIACVGAYVCIFKFGLRYIVQCLVFFSCFEIIQLEERERWLLYSICCVYLFSMCLQITVGWSTL